MAKKNMLTGSEIASFCEQLGFIIKSGISLREGLLLMSEDSANTRLGAALSGKILQALEFGDTFAHALKKTGMFPAYVINMVNIGETSGKLQEVLESLSAYYERSEAISRNIKSAVTYPLVMIVMMIAVIFIIIVEVLPVFQGVFQQLGSELSGFVQGIMQFGEAVSRSSVVIAVVAAVIILGFFLLRGTQAGKKLFAALYEKMFRKSALAVASGRFASAMTLMLQSGMDVDSSLDMTYQLIDNNNSRKKIEMVKNSMQMGGKSFAQAIVDAGIFTGLYGKMITVGFKTGTLDVVMGKIASHYDDEINRRINSLIAALEPTLVVILSVIVGLILLSVMLPLMGVMSAIG